MRNLRRLPAAAALIGLCVGGAAARAATYTANFNTSTLDPHLVVTSSSQFSQTTGGGVLTEIQSATQTPSAGQIYVSTDFSVPENFVYSVTVDFSNLSNVQENAFANVNFSATTLASVYENASGTPSGGGFYLVNGEAVPQSNVSLSSPDVFEIERTGDTVSEYVNGDLVASLTDPAFIGPAVPSIGLDNYGGSGLAESVGFSNFSISYAVPEPATWALMLTGLAGLGAAVRQRRPASRPSAA